MSTPTMLCPIGEPGRKARLTLRSPAAIALAARASRIPARASRANGVTSTTSCTAAQPRLVGCPVTVVPAATRAAGSSTGTSDPPTSMPAKLDAVGSSSIGTRRSVVARTTPPATPPTPPVGPE
jgi:hypothetical protein